MFLSGVYNAVMWYTYSFYIWLHVHGEVTITSRLFRLHCHLSDNGCIEFLINKYIIT